MAWKEEGLKVVKKEALSPVEKRAAWWWLAEGAWWKGEAPRLEACWEASSLSRRFWCPRRSLQGTLYYLSLQQYREF